MLLQYCPKRMLVACTTSGWPEVSSRPRTRPMTCLTSSSPTTTSKSSSGSRTCALRPPLQVGTMRCEELGMHGGNTFTPVATARPKCVCQQLEVPIHGVEREDWFSAMPPVSWVRSPGCKDTIRAPGRMKRMLFCHAPSRPTTAEAAAKSATCCPNPSGICSRSNTSAHTLKRRDEANV